MVVSVSVLALIVLIAMSFIENVRLPSADRLPIHWTLSGKINRTAPRLIALFFAPVVAGIVFAGIAVMPGGGSIRPMVTICIAAAAFILIHARHLWMIRQSLK